MAIRSDKIGQSWLLPLAVSELVPEDHICNLVEVVVDNMDVGEIEQKYRSRPGNPAYSRRMLLRLVIMASVDPIWSLKKRKSFLSTGWGDATIDDIYFIKCGIVKVIQNRKLN